MRKVSVSEKKISDPIPISKINLGFGSRYWNRILVSHYCKAQYIAFIWLQIMTVQAKFQTPLACFEKWLSPDFTCQKVEEAQKVSLKGCASAILLHHYKSSRPRWIVRRCMAQWVEISSEIVLFFLMNLKSFPEIKLDFLYIVASALNFLPWEFLLVKKLEKPETTKYTT